MNTVTKGVLFSLVAVLMWGILSLTMQQILPRMNSQTLIAYRFLFAVIVLGIALCSSKNMPKRALILIIIGIIGLTGKFLLFSTAPYFTEPAATQVIAQLTPFIMLAASVFWLKEFFGKHQFIGAGVLFVGILLFFNQKVPVILSGSGNSQFIGVTVWVAYGLVQKLLSAIFRLLMLVPLVTIIFTHIFHAVAPQKFMALALNILAYCGALLVVLGAIFSIVGHMLRRLK